MAYYASILEGKQAEEYKAKKAAEEKAKEDGFKERLDKRYKVTTVGKSTYTHPDMGRKMTDQNPNNSIFHPIKKAKGIAADKELEKQIQDKTRVKDKHGHWGYGNGYDVHTKSYQDGKHKSTEQVRTELLDGEDAIRRHFRRHPEKLAECGIFGECSFM